MKKLLLIAILFAVLPMPTRSAEIQQPKTNSAALPAVPKTNKAVAAPSAKQIPGTATAKFKVQGALVVDPPESKPYQPIVAGCSCIIPQNADTEIKISWVLDEHCKGIQSADGSQMYLWSPPGEHEISVLVEAKLYESIIVLVHDPNDATKTVDKKIRVLVDMSRDTYTATFSVIEPIPPTPPVPPPALELQQAVAPVMQVMANADKAKAATFANAWNDFQVALRSNAPLKTNAEFRNAITQFLNAAVAKANLQGAFPGFSAALESALTKVFTNQDGTLDNQKALDFVNAIIWATKPAK